MSGKIQIPDDLKRDLPQTGFGRILGATPIVMTVIATLLAGLASSEMTRAQYHRAFAAQLQSKAGDQWSFFQAKRLRSAMARNTVGLLQATGEVGPFPADALPGGDPVTVAALGKGQLPVAPKAELDDSIKAVLAAEAAGRPESEVQSMMAGLDEAALARALSSARAAANAFDKAIRPINEAIDRLEATLTTGDRQLLRDFAAARLHYAAERYDREARLNQTIAAVYELQVGRANSEAEHHHRRSTNFFFGMLAAQAAVIVSTFSIAARRRSFLWSLAATAGFAAVSFAAYVYFYI